MQPFLLHSGLVDLPWWGYVLAALALTHVTIASVTIFLHRHQAHRALDLGPVASHFFRFWLWLTTGMITKEWAAIHRKHHARCETAEDPHSPQVLGINRVLWGGVFLYVKESRNRDTVERYGHGTPDDWIERKVYTPFNKYGILVMALIDIVLFGDLIGPLVWAVQMAWIPFWAAGVINGLGHYWGYRNFDCADASTNLVPWGILIGGEELHNNHHTFASSAKLSARWYEFDIGWMYIRILQALGQARVKKTLPKLKFADAKPVVDLDTLQAIITHRYDVMTHYMKSFRKVCREELRKLQETRHDLLDSKSARSIRRWLARSEENLSAPQKEKLQTVLQHSNQLWTIYAMKRELAGLWQRSTASREQLLKQLQDWCHRAEQSGIEQLQEFSLRLRRYAV